MSRDHWCIGWLTTSVLCLGVATASQVGTGISSNLMPLQAQVAPNPRIGLAKRVVSTVFIGNGNFLVTYEFVVGNYGNVDLTNTQVTENLTTTFGTTPFTVNSISSPSNNLTLNPNYNGRNDINLLAGTDTLLVGQSKTLRLVIMVTSDANARTYNNQAAATAQSPNGPVSDLSQNGINPDPDNDGNPTNNNGGTSVNLRSPLTPPHCNPGQNSCQP
ncbi:MAG TPA: hypothetical protein V6D26_30765 [Stenomitos sp.]